MDQGKEEVGLSLERKYWAMLDRVIADKDMFDGRGKINMYSCIHGHPTITIDKHKGRTPSILPCPICGGEAKSWSYNLPHSSVGELTPKYEWYRPSLEEFLRMGQPTLDNILEGGLLLRELEEKHHTIPTLIATQQAKWGTKGNWQINKLEQSMTTMIHCKDTHKVLVNGTNIGGLFDLILEGSDMKKVITIIRDCIEYGEKADH